MVIIKIKLDYSTMDRLRKSWLWEKISEVIMSYRCIEWDYEEVDEV